jgi:hypothetical protein
VDSWSIFFGGRPKKSSSSTPGFVYDEQKLFRRGRSLQNINFDMLHQLVFQSLNGEIDYGARGDFNSAGPDKQAQLCLGLHCRGSALQGSA